MARAPKRSANITSIPMISYNIEMRLISNNIGAYVSRFKSFLTYRVTKLAVTTHPTDYITTRIPLHKIKGLPSRSSKARRARRQAPGGGRGRREGQITEQSKQCEGNVSSGR